MKTEFGGSLCLSRSGWLTSYSPFTPGMTVLIDIPGDKHFLLLILTRRGVGLLLSCFRKMLQQENSITSLWSLNTTPQMQVGTRRSGRLLQVHCLAWTLKEGLIVNLLCQSQDQLFVKASHHVWWLFFCFVFCRLPCDFWLLRLVLSDSNILKPKHRLSRISFIYALKVHLKLDLDLCVEACIYRVRGYLSVSLASVVSICKLLTWNYSISCAFWP